MLKQIGEEKVKLILSDFMCPLNEDVEYFLRTKSIEFSNKGFAQTHLVYWVSSSYKELVGYYSLATKPLIIAKKDVSNSLYNRIKKHDLSDR